jgi:phosphatidylglycerol:prolipoprotein diacylglycerol transferase
MWYGLLIAVGFGLCIYFICQRAPKHGLTGDKVLNYALFIAVAGIVGARLYYVLFNLPDYMEDPARIRQVREGGLAIHGGSLVGGLVAFFLSRRWKDQLLNLTDLFFAVVPLGQAIGRWGNYFNQEAHGGPTDLPWGILVDGQKVHPTFLYESLWCFLIFFLLIYIDNRRRFMGQTFLLYCILYSAERFFVEGLRTDSLMLGSLRQAQVLSVVVIVGAVAAYILLYRRYRASGAEPLYKTARRVADDAGGDGNATAAGDDSGNADSERVTVDGEKPEKESS